ncbi:MAG: hydrogenase [Candidatus Omnitrophica bacterium]|nr:hydrogenase [Candidatus Omnitrophota bacterium]
MILLIDLIIVAIVLMNLMMLSSSRIRTCIRIVAVEGILVGLVPIIADINSITFSAIISSFFNITLKGFVFPWLLYRAAQEANIRKEVEPIGGYALSLLLGVILFLIATWLSTRLLYVKPLFSNIVVSVSFATFFTGVLIIVSRTKAITQVLGYIVLENGIYLFGVSLLAEQHLLVELAILLDIFVAVFVMGIAIFHISREFDHIDTHNLSELKDWIKLKQE